MKKLNINEIRELLPQRSPFLFLDEIEVHQEAKKAVGYWTAKPSWPVFKGHFPDHPVVPGVILIEVMAQACLILGVELDPTTRDKPVFLAGVDHARFRRPVFPDDQVQVNVKFEKRRRHLWAFDGDVRVRGKLAGQAKLLAAVQEKWS